eukprot:SAG22_NODE_835_length_6917_cov_8.098709_2_plen_36_part_00
MDFFTLTWWLALPRILNGLPLSQKPVAARTDRLVG